MHDSTMAANADNTSMAKKLTVQLLTTPFFARQFARSAAYILVTSRVVASIANHAATSSGT
jgi:hypothetical protein